VALGKGRVVPRLVIGTSRTARFATNNERSRDLLGEVDRTVVTRGRRARPFATAKFLVTLGDLDTFGRGSHRGIPPASGRLCHPTLSRRFLHLRTPSHRRK